MPQDINLILYNARVVTLDPTRDPACPEAQAVAVVGETIAAVGSSHDLLRLGSQGATAIDCQGLTLIPGLNDAHCHLLATAAALSGLDCSPGRVSGLPDLLEQVRRRAGEMPPGRWVRGYGLEPALLAEGRYPSRQELDAAAAVNPVRLEYSSGHAAVLNSAALAAAGITADTPDPAEGVIERDAATGEPTGRLLEMAGYLRQRLGHTRSREELDEGVTRLNEKLLGYGITSVQDAGPGNGMAQWDTFRSMKDAGRFNPRITMLAGAGKLAEFVEAGMTWGAGDDRLRLGHAKLMLTLTTGSLHPAPADLAALAGQCLAMGFPFAVHAIERKAVAAVLDLPQLSWPPALKDGGAGLTRSGLTRTGLSGPRNRIEHCAEGTPDLLKRIAESGAAVVTQPGFIYWRGDGYLERVERELLPYLYDTAEMAAREIPLAFSSDAPVIDPSPWPGIYAAVTSGTAGGRLLPRAGGSKSSGRDGYAAANDGLLNVYEALAAYSRGGAMAEGMAGRKGMIRPGMLADLALIDADLDAGRVESLKDARSRLTVIGGKIVRTDGIG